MNPFTVQLPRFQAMPVFGRKHFIRSWKVFDAETGLPLQTGLTQEEADQLAHIRNRP